MYLRAIRLRGFKSFAKKTDLLLEPGVAVVIGPNGSGKSNLAEAVMWALGEQSPSSVRGASMQDVIFAGSDGRRAAGGAEVELTFDNSDGAVPLPTPEISILRRVRRDGQSEYRINQAACRLSDVVELMSAVGLGKELHSIIGQGRVESFLSSKPADRRAMVEEAAGLGRYKRRRERAVLKLRETQRNLERARDLEREVAMQISPLRRQASAAEQLRAAERELEEARGRLLAGELATLDARLAAYREQIAGCAAEGERLDAELVTLAEGRTAQEEELARALREREQRAMRALRARALVGRLEGCERLTEQRARLFEEVLRSAEAERDRLLTDLAAQSDQEDTWPQERLALQAALERASAEHTRTADRVAEARRVSAERRAEVSRAEAERYESVVRAARLVERRSALRAELGTLEREMRELETEASALESSLTAALTERTRLDEAEMTAVGELERAIAAEEEAARGLAAAEARRAERGADVAAASAEAAQLAAALSALQDVDEETAGVLARYPGVAGLADGLHCDEGYELALGAALSYRGSAVVVPGDVDRWTLLGALRAAGIRVARLVLPRGGAAAEDVAAAGLEPLLARVQGAQGRVRELLTSAYVADDLRAVPSTFEGIAVTRRGEYYRPASGELGVAAGLPAAVLLERRGRLAAVERRRTEAEGALQWAEEDARTARQVAEGRTGERMRREHEVEGARAAAARARRESNALQARAQEAASARARATRKSEAHLAELAGLDDEVEALERRAAEVLVAAQHAAGPLAEAEAAVVAAEEEHEHALSMLTRCRVELEQRAASAERAAAEREARQAKARAAQERLQTLQKRLASVPQAVTAAAALRQAVHSLLAVASTAAERLEQADDRGLRVPDREGLRQMAVREAEIRRSADDARERRIAAQVEVARLEERRGDVVAAWERVAGRLEVAHFAPPADEDEAAALARAVERVERRIERIGPVNPLAEAECAELGERAAFLREQRRDMEHSLQELETLIAEMTGRVDAGFAEMFGLVQGHFSHMIETLFPGGRGMLTLTAGEEGEEAGIAMQVKPGRKLGKRLTMLSGGERSLAAIAFLMSLMLARPSPFYILDEIEAALDDVNIGRLVGLVREYRTRTQFIIITHQKRTMEAADILYGVTMGEDAVSRVVSARMAEEEIERRSEAD